jgi:hypothetical protein
MGSTANAVVSNRSPILYELCGLFSGAEWNGKGGKDGGNVRKVVGARGFEPPTPRSRTECSTRLSHAPTKA